MSKVLSYLKGHAYLAKPGHLCTKQALCAVLRNLLELSKELTAGVGTRNPTKLFVVNETQPAVNFAPHAVQDQAPILQMGGLVDWRYCDGTTDLFSLLP